MKNPIEIKDLNAPELDAYARISEVQLLRYYEPDPGLFVGESLKVIDRALTAGYEPVSFLVEHKELEGEAGVLVTKYPEIPVYTAEYEVLAKLTGYAMTRGVLAVMRRKELPSVEEVCQNARRIAVLENVVNPTNIGAIFRSAAALHMDAVLLSPGCCDPLYRRAARVSMGTVFQIPWTSFDKKISWPGQGMELLWKMGFKTAAMALRKDTVGIDDPALLGEPKLAVFLGNEGDGLLSETIEHSDYRVCIPMSHGVDSLNVAAASAVAFWELGKAK
nr:RNA methyltransferase [uncultured Blautia sp.]